MNLSEIFTKFKEGLKGKKVQEHYQTVERPLKGTPGQWASVWCTSANFELQILILKERQIFKFFIFP